MPQTPDMLESAASSALPQSSGTGGPASNSQQQLMQVLLQAAAQQHGGQPGATSAQTQTPTPHMPSEIPVGHPQVPQGSFASTGAARRANKQATLDSIANLTQMGTKMYHEKQVRDMEHLTTRVDGARTGVEQAQAMLKQDPNNAEAKQQLQQNQKIISDVFSDPKNVKKFEKAYSVKLLGDDKGKATPEYQGLQKAIQSKDKAAQAQAGTAMAQKFDQSFPKTQQMSPAMQTQAALVKLGIQPKAGEQLEAQTKMLEAVQRFATGQGHDDARIALGKTLAETKDRQMANDLTKASMQINGRVATAQVLSEAALQRTKIMANTQMEDTKWRMAGSILAKREGTAANQKQMSALSTEYQRIQTELKNTQTAMDKQDYKWFNRDKIKANTDRLDNLRKQQEQLLQKMNSLNFGESIAGLDSSTEGSGAGSGNKDSESTGFDKYFEGLLSESGDSSGDQN